MNNKLILLFLTVCSSMPLLLNQISFAESEYHHCPPLCYEQDPEPPTFNMSAPIVNYPTHEEVIAYLNESGKKKEFNTVANSTEIGIPSEYQVKVVEKYQDLVWMAFLGTLQGTGSVYIERSQDGGHNFTDLTLLSNQTAGSAGNLQFDISDDGRLVYVVWENWNNVTNKTSIYVSSSMDSGKSFKTYSLNHPNDGNATNPIIEIIDNNLLILWTQEAPSYGTEGGHTHGTIIDSHGRRW